MSRRSWAGHHRGDDNLHGPVHQIVSDVDLLPYSDEPGYQEARRRAELEWADQMAAGAVRDAASLPSGSPERQTRVRLAAWWRSIVDRLTIGDHWNSGEGDRKLF